MATPEHVEQPEVDRVATQAQAGVQTPALSAATARFSPGSALALQRSMGNLAVGRLLAQREPTPDSLIVDDEAQVATGQMTKTQFLAELRGAVTATANEALAAVGRTAADCPYIDKAFSRYAGQSATQVETALHRYAPEAAAARTARDYLAPVSTQVRAGIGRWIASGGPEMTESDGLSAAGGFIGNAISGAVSAIGRLLFKARGGGAREADPVAVQASLGSGRPLDGSTRTRMESALGSDFGHVRVHDDTAAANTASELNARAFTVGSDIAFAAGGYDPGTPVGDALLAHELAHVMQQGPAVSAKDETGDDHGLEADADRVAAHGLVALWGDGLDVSAELAGRPTRTSQKGLRLQRCSALPDTQEKSWLDMAKARSGADLDKQATTPQVELVALELAAARVRATAVAKNLIPKDVLEPWDEAFKAVVMMQPKQQTGAIDESLKSKASAAMETFYTNFRKVVANRDTTEHTGGRGGVSITKNPFLTQGALEGEQFPIFGTDHDGILKRLHEAKSLADWTAVVADFRKVAQAMDRYIAEQLHRDAKKDEEKVLAGKDTEAGDAVTRLEASLSGTIDQSARGAAITAMEAFAVTLRSTVEHADYMKEVRPIRSSPYMARTNDFLTKEGLESFQYRLQRAQSADELRAVVAEYRTLRAARDRYLKDDKVLGHSDDADRLVHSAGVARGIDELRQSHPEAEKIRCVFYPEPAEDEVEEPGYKPVAIPIELFLYKEGDEWCLRDVTTALEPKENKTAGSADKQTALKALFAELDSKLRFPRGLLTYRALDGNGGEQRTTASWELSDWLTLIGITLAVAALTVATAGAATAATVLIIGSSLAGAGAAAAAMSEKSEQGVLTTEDIVVGVADIATQLLTAASAGMGRIVATGVGKTGTMARVAVLADRLYVPTTKAMIAGNVISFITVSAKGMQDLEKLEKAGGSEDERRVARERLTQQMLLMGTITLLGVRGDVASIQQGRNLYLDPDFAEGGIARAMMSNSELLSAAKKAGASAGLEALLLRKDLPPELLDRLNAELSDAFSKSVISDNGVKLVLKRMPGTATAQELEEVLEDLRKANRLVHAEVVGPKGKVLIDDVNGELRVRALLPDEELFKHAKALGTDNTLEAALARTDFDAPLRDEIRRELSTALATGQIDKDGVASIIGGLKRASGATQARETLAELLHANRIAESKLAKDGKVIMGAVPGQEYQVGPHRLTVDPVPDADVLYAGADNLAHIDEVKNTANGLRQKLEQKPQQLANMKTWAAADPANRRIAVVIESEQGWTTLLAPAKGADKRAVFKQLSESGTPLYIGGRELTPAQLDTLWDAIIAKAKATGKFPPKDDFMALMPTIAEAEKFLGIKL